MEWLVALFFDAPAAVGTLATAAFGASVVDVVGMVFLLLIVVVDTDVAAVLSFEVGFEGFSATLSVPIAAEESPLSISFFGPDDSVSFSAFASYTGGIFSTLFSSFISLSFDVAVAVDFFSSAPLSSVVSALAFS